MDSCHRHFELIRSHDACRKKAKNWRIFYRWRTWETYVRMPSLGVQRRKGGGEGQRVRPELLGDGISVEPEYGTS